MTKDEAIKLIQANKDFLIGMFKYKNAPNHDNSIAKLLIKAWQTLLNDMNSKVIIPNCWTCGGKHPLIDLYIHAEKNNWFIEETETIVKSKRKRINE